MEIKLDKRPKNPIIIEGFPGFGLVGTISTEFLIDHLGTEQIGKIVSNDLPAMVAIHEERVIDPFGIFYDKKNNIVLVHAINSAAGVEWDIADTISKLVKDLEAKELISIEGVGSSSAATTMRTFYHSHEPKTQKRFKELSIEPLKEGIIMGVTGAVLLRVDTCPVTCIFAETHTDLPDSQAAANVIKALDKYLNLKVDYKPLLDQAEKFEKKLQGIMKKGVETEQQIEQKKLSYVG